MNEEQALKWAVNELTVKRLMELTGLSKSTVVRLRSGLRQVSGGAQEGLRKGSGNDPYTSSSNIDLNTTYLEETAAPPVEQGDMKSLIEAWNKAYSAKTGARYALTARDRGQLIACLKRAPLSDVLRGVEMAWSVDNWFLENNQLHPGTFAKHLPQFLALRAPIKTAEQVMDERREAKIRRELGL